MVSVGWSSYSQGLDAQLGCLKQQQNKGEHVRNSMGVEDPGLMFGMAAAEEKFPAWGMCSWVRHQQWSTKAG